MENSLRHNEVLVDTHTFSFKFSGRIADIKKTINKRKIYQMMLTGNYTIKVLLMDYINVENYLEVSKSTTWYADLQLIRREY